jgi:hypothetical protein
MEYTKEHEYIYKISLNLYSLIAIGVICNTILSIYKYSHKSIQTSTPTPTSTPTSATTTTTSKCKCAKNVYFNENDTYIDTDNTNNTDNTDNTDIRDE